MHSGHWGRTAGVGSSGRQGGLLARLTKHHINTTPDHQPKPTLLTQRGRLACRRGNAAPARPASCSWRPGTGRWAGRTSQAAGAGTWRGCLARCPPQQTHWWAGRRCWRRGSRASGQGSSRRPPRCSPASLMQAEVSIRAGVPGAVGREGCLRLYWHTFGGACSPL